MIEIIFDTETTGLLKPQENDIEQQPKIIEICCYKIQRIGTNIELIGIYDELIDPDIAITPEIERITGINNAMVKGKGKFIKHLPLLQEFFLGAHTLIAHNLAFDLNVLANEVHRCGKVLNFPWPIKHICTVEKTLHIEQRRLNMQRLHEYLFGKGFPDAHRAKTDVDALFKCYKELVKRGIIK